MALSNVRITPNQRMISDRFPVASFVVQVPPERVFEIACASDPTLFRSDAQSRRTPDNFFSTRAGGLLRAPKGEATYLVPSDQLRRFAGARRLYYAVGSYRDPRGEGAEFTVSPDVAESAPHIQISPDFTGRSLDRARLGAQTMQARYGNASGALSWGGDLAARPTPASRQSAPPADYDDGYSSDLWKRPRAMGGAEAPTSEVDSMSAEPPGYEDGPAVAASDEQPSALAARTYGGTSTEQEEADGFEDAPALATASPASPTFGGRGEPHGFEDGAAAMAARGREPRYGRVDHVDHVDRVDRGGRVDRVMEASAQPSPSPIPPAEPTRAIAGRDAQFSEEDLDVAVGELPQDAPGASLRDVRPAPLAIPEKFKIVLVVAAAESGRERYSAVNADSEYEDPNHPAYHRYHLGLSWGLVQFTQRGGALGRVLTACQRRDAEAFRATFGPASDDLLRTTTAPSAEERVAPVSGAPLWQEPWLTTFRRAGQVPAFQAAQNEVAIEGYFDPNLPLAAWLGLDTDRALAMLYDRTVHMGIGGARVFVLQAVGVIRSQRQLAAALVAVGAADVTGFQRQIPELAADGRFGPLTHAALMGSLRALGDRSPIAVPSLGQMLDQLVNASRGKGFEARLRGLRQSSELVDTVYQVG